MRGIRKRTVAKISAAVIALAAAFAIISGVTWASNRGNEPFLGDCIEYGIVCNRLNQTAHMETNFIAGKYEANGQANGNTVNEHMANAAGEIRIGELVGECKFTNSQKPVVVIDESVKREAEEKIAEVKQYAESVVKKNDYDAPDVTDQNNYNLDISGVDKDVVYVDMTKFVDASNSGKVQEGALKIKMLQDQTIVLNIKEKNEFKLCRYTLDVIDGKKSREEQAETVIWNAPYLNNLTIKSDNMRATVIAPTAFVNLITTAEGWLVCDSVVENSGEWHMISRKIGKVTPTPSPTLTKEPEKEPTKEPTATPTKTPAETASPEKTETPKDEPTVKPTKTPEGTESPSETETPSKTETAPPEKTETPKDEPTVKPTKTPEGTKNPSETKTPSPEKPETPKDEPTAKPTKTPSSTKDPDDSDLPTAVPTADPGDNLPETPTPNPGEDPSVDSRDEPPVSSVEDPENTPDVSQIADPGDKPDVDSDENPENTPKASLIDNPGDKPAVDSDNDSGSDEKKKQNPDDNEVSTIQDDETPLSSANNTRKKATPKKKQTTILDEDVPLSDSAPETGDTTNLLFPVLIMGVSLIAIVICFVVRRRAER